MSDIYLQITETPTVVTLSAPVVSGALASTVTVANTVTVALDSNSLSALENVTVTVGAAITGTVTVSNFPASQAVTFSAVTISNFPATQPVSIASVTVGNTVTIAGTVTANVDVTQNIAPGISDYANNYAPFPVAVQYGTLDFVSGIRDGAGQIFGTDINFPANIVDSLPAGSNIIGQVQINGTPPVIISDGTARIGVVTVGAGTVTLGASTAQIGSVTASISGTIPVSISSVTIGNSITIGSCVTHGVTIANTSVTVNGTFYQATQPVSLASLPALVAGTAQIGSVTASISANPSGALTTRFGSVTTANTAQITTAVTNTSRKYLFAQNISVGSVTVGIGFSPTTTQGIQLSAGSGIVFDSFCPTGAVYWLGATTGAAWSILEG